MVKPIPVYLEAGDKKVFACSIDFPGWCRSAKTEELALEALAAYAPRYAEVAERARAAFPAPARAGERFEVVERVKGKGATDFGVPHEIPEADAEPLTARQAARQVELMRAAWATLDRVAKALGRASDGSRPSPKGWPPRYAIRRIAWHVLDHAWEMQDRADPGA